MECININGELKCMSSHKKENSGLTMFLLLWVNEELATYFLHFTN
jgi:hypothetical protein